MSQMIFDDETLMAFVDGELDEVTAKRVARAMAEDVALAARLAMFRSSREAVATAMKPLANVPVPPGLTLSVAAAIERDRAARARDASVATSHVLSFDELRATRGKVSGWIVPVAAMLVLAIGGTGGYFFGSTLRPHVPTEFAAINDPDIIQALSEIPSGKTIDVPGTGKTIEPVLSFRLEDGTLCREYTLKGPDSKGVVSIACLEQDRWTTHLLMAATRPEDGFVPAGSAETIDAYLASIHAGSPLEGDAEDEVLRSIRR
jgi:hypothetical protein